MCRNLTRLAGSEIVMLTKSDDREYGYLGRYTVCIFVCVDSLSNSIGRVRPEAVSLTSTSLYLSYRKVKRFLKKITLIVKEMAE